jgi:hypothetical protein
LVVIGESSPALTDLDRFEGMVPSSEVVVAAVSESRLIEER